MPCDSPSWDPLRALKSETPILLPTPLQRSLDCLPLLLLLREDEKATTCRHPTHRNEFIESTLRNELVESIKPVPMNPTHHRNEVVESIERFPTNEKSPLTRRNEIVESIERLPTNEGAFPTHRKEVAESIVPLPTNEETPPIHRNEVVESIEQFRMIEETSMTHRNEAESIERLPTNEEPPPSHVNEPSAPPNNGHHRHHKERLLQLLPLACNTGPSHHEPLNGGVASFVEGIPNTNVATNRASGDGKGPGMASSCTEFPFAVQ